MKIITLILLSILLISKSFSYVATCPSRCQCYEDLEDRQRSLHLICKWEQVNSTNLNSLGRPDRVRTLTIRCPHSITEFSTPPPGIFHGLRNLDRLEIDRCLLRNLPPALLSGLHKLYSLIMKNSKLDDVPKDFFGYVPNLMTLDLTGNKLRIEPYSLRSLKNLIHLDLSNNSITFLANTFISLTKLKVLNMDHNKLTNIDFRRLPEELTDLSLRHNSINTIHYVPNSARYLRRLDLSGNELEHISSTGSVNVLPVSLRSVDLSHNRINYIQEGAITKASKLSVLDLKNNFLHELKETTVSGASTTKLRIFLADNQLNCHCNIRWLLHLNEASSVIISDLDQLNCNHIIEPNRTIALAIADSTNQLMCKYAEFCPSTCRCCPDEKCKCRSTCPTGCTCYRSANVESPRTSMNTIMCDRVRLDRLESLPSTLTDLRLNNVEWKEWPYNIFNETNLKSLAITNSALTDEEARTLIHIPTLADLDISSNEITSIPPNFEKLSRLRMADNPLKDFRPSDIAVLDHLKLISLSGNLTRFKCDCESPSNLQRWLRDSRNRQKIEDIEDLNCHLSSFGRVLIIDTLPGKDSLCMEENVDTKEWLNFVKNAQKKPTLVSTLQTLDNRDTILLAEINKENHQETDDENEELNDKRVEHEDEMTIMTPTTFTSSDEENMMEMEEDDDSETTSERTSTSVVVTTTIIRKTSRPTMPSTTTRNWKKYSKEESDENKFINALIVVLVIAVVVLVFAIAATLYYRLEAVEEEMEREGPEQRPLTD